MELFTFMKWPLIACLILPWLLVYLGLHIVEREIIFVDLALAQIAALGSSLSIVFGFDVHDWQSYAFSVVFTLVGAIIFTLTRTQSHKVPQEALIGIIYVVAAAGGILALSKSAGGSEELQRSMIGELLVVTPREILQTFALFVVVGMVHFLFRRKFLAISFEPEAAVARGISVRWWDFLFYALFGLVVTSFVHIGGVLLVFSYLIIPAICGAYLAKSLLARLAVGWLIATLASMASLYVTTRVDLPLGAAIVCGLGLMLVLTIAWSAFQKKAVGVAGNTTKAVPVDRLN
ncbi:MAG TPA: iron chelate uptake ABC transporter family permease subunit [Candidatus Saccharimonadales bacterium]|nr:iron chelate uptake ABC transporter family permease subunit [Candidatus Saccharimonadales bacterium]